MDGIPALDMWDLIIEVSHFPMKQAQGNPERTHQQPNQDNLDLVKVFFFFSQTHNLIDSKQPRIFVTSK